jgi:hypothetical protein
MRITLCGSTRFKSDFEAWNHKLAINGHTVYSLSLFAREEKDVGKESNITISENEKVTLDLVHLDKILNSDAIVVINIGGYTGFSTKREIEWAKMKGKRVYSIEPALSEDAAMLVRK